MNQTPFCIPWFESNGLMNLKFADNIALLGNTIKSIQEMTESLDRDALKIGIWINLDKKNV